MRLASLAVVAAALLLAGCAAVPGSNVATPTSTPVAVATTTPTPTPTQPAVQWQDAESWIITPSEMLPEHLPHGPSWVTAGGHLMCGVYDDMPEQVKGDDPTRVFYGCRIDQLASTFTYPDFEDESKGMIGGCPSGFRARAGDVPAPLCNSGVVFASEVIRTNVLHPGQGVRFAGIECVATGDDAMECTEPATAHGFRASLSDYALS